MTAENKNAEVDHSNGRLAGRLKTLIPLLTIAAVAALAVWLAFVLFRAMPQQTVAMAVYPNQSTSRSALMRSTSTRQARHSSSAIFLSG